MRSEMKFSGTLESLLDAGDPDKKAETLREAVLETAGGSCYLSISQLTRLLNRSEQTVRNHLSEGGFPIPSVTAGRRRLFHVDDVVAFLDDVMSAGQRSV